MSFPREPEVSVEELSSWIRNHPESWTGSATDSEFSDERLADIAERALVLVHDRERRRRRRRRRIVAAGVGGVTFVAGTVGVAAWLRSEPPTAPQAGIVCRSGATVDADASVIEPGIDPIAGCREVLETSDFGGDAANADLVACIGAGGAIEVFPGTDATCGQLGLVLADRQPTSENAAIIALQDRLSVEINLEECENVSAVAEMAEAILGESDLTGWTVAIDPSSADGVCGKADVDPVSETVVVVEF